jgi:hypothetical protein
VLLTAYTVSEIREILTSLPLCKLSWHKSVFMSAMFAESMQTGWQVQTRTFNYSAINTKLHNMLSTIISCSKVT